MSIQDPPTPATGVRARLVDFFSDLRAIIVGITAAIAILIAFIDAVAGLVTRTEPVACTALPWLPWCRDKSIATPATTMTWSDAVGGPGGTPFSTTTCRDDELLVGLFGKADETLVYSIGPVCAPASFNPKRQLVFVSEATRNGGEAGSDRGKAFSLKCGVGMYVVGYQFDSAVIGTNFGPNEYLVTPLRLKCSPVSADYRASTIVTMASPAQSNASRKPFMCEDGSGAFGIRGKAGQFVDSISLGCRSIR